MTTMPKPNTKTTKPTNRKQRKANMSQQFGQMRSDATRDCMKRVVTCSETLGYIPNGSPSAGAIVDAPGSTPTKKTGFVWYFDLDRSFLASSDSGRFFEIYTSYRVTSITATFRWMYQAANNSVSIPCPYDSRSLNQVALKIWDSDAFKQAGVTVANIFGTIDPVGGLADLKGTKIADLYRSLTVNWRPLDNTDWGCYATNGDTQFAYLAAATNCTLANLDTWFPKAQLGLKANVEFYDIKPMNIDRHSIFKHEEATDDFTDIESELMKLKF